MNVQKVSWVGVAVLVVGAAMGQALAQSPRIPLPAGNLTNPPQTCPQYIFAQIGPNTYYYYALYYGIGTPCDGSPQPTGIQGNFPCPQTCPNCTAAARVAGDATTAAPYPGRKKAVEPTHDPRKTGDGAGPDVTAEMLKFSEFLPAENGHLRFYMKDGKGRLYVCYRVRLTLEPSGGSREFPLEREIYFGYEMRSDATVPQTVYQTEGMEPIDADIAVGAARAFRCNLPKGILSTQYGQGDIRHVLLLQAK